LRNNFSESGEVSGQKDKPKQSSYSVINP